MFHCFRLSSVAQVRISTPIKLIDSSGPPRSLANRRLSLKSVNEKIHYHSISGPKQFFNAQKHAKWNNSDVKEVYCSSKIDYSRFRHSLMCELENSVLIFIVLVESSTSGFCYQLQHTADRASAHNKFPYLFVPLSISDFTVI